MADRLNPKVSPTLGRPGKEEQEQVSRTLSIFCRVFFWGSGLSGFFRHMQPSLSSPPPPHPTPPPQPCAERRWRPWPSQQASNAGLTPGEAFRLKTPTGGGGKIHKMALVASKPNNQTAYNKISKIHRKQDKNHQATQKPEQPPTKYLIKA